MRRARRALVVANEGDEDSGFVGDRLREHGYTLVLALREAVGSWPDPHDFDLVLSLGSAWSAYWNDVAEAVNREKETLRQAAAARMPVLGICFGSQVLAAALGGDAMRAPAKEVGWLPVATHDADLIGEGPWFLLHGDSWTAPPGGRVLASTGICPQAFTLDRVLGVQFHPEVTPEMVENWAARDPSSLASAGLEPGALIDQTRALAPDAQRRASALVDAFLERTSTYAPPVAAESP